MAKFYYQDDGESFGPFNVEEMLDFGIPLEMPVKKEGEDQWKTAGDFEELAPLRQMHEEAVAAYEANAKIAEARKNQPVTVKGRGPNLAGRIVLFILGLGFGLGGVAGMVGFINTQDPGAAVIGGFLGFVAIILFYLTFKKRPTITYENSADAAQGIAMAHMMNMDDFSGGDDGGVDGEL